MSGSPPVAAAAASTRQRPRYSTAPSPKHRPDRRGSSMSRAAFKRHEHDCCSESVQLQRTGPDLAGVGFTSLGHNLIGDGTRGAGYQWLKGDMVGTVSAPSTETRPSGEQRRTTRKWPSCVAVRPSTESDQPLPPPTSAVCREKWTATATAAPSRTSVPSNGERWLLAGPEAAGTRRTTTMYRSLAGATTMQATPPGGYGRMGLWSCWSSPQ